MNETDAIGPGKHRFPRAHPNSDRSADYCFQRTRIRSSGESRWYCAEPQIGYGLGRAGKIVGNGEIGRGSQRAAVGYRSIIIFCYRLRRAASVGNATDRMVSIT